ncbi:MAG: N-carbamoyl-D-amino-acid hydrolase [Alphaproteobacteria bacterium]|nr:N-carbamoyl-D-amino-acid hydrolase [Alphaproteobacteria bacterium]
MTRLITVGGAQLGPIARAESRQAVVRRLIDLLIQAHERRCDLVVFPEIALTTFFPRWWMEDQDEIDSFFEREMPGSATRPLFEEAIRRGIGFCLGFAELAREDEATRRYNSAILVDKAGKVVGKYRKVHLPGHADHRPEMPFQHLEKRYFDVGNLGFNTWRTMGGVMGMCICNDRRWPETYRVMGLKGVEVVMLGYNTPTHVPWMPIYDHLNDFHNHLCMQAGAYQNATYVVGVAKAGNEEGCMLLGGSTIVAPSGEIIAMTTTLGDELITARLDLDLCAFSKNAIFNFAQHRRIEHYGLIATQTAAIAPD